MKKTNEQSIGTLAASYAVPATVRTNGYWIENEPTLVAEAERHGLAQLWKRREAPTPNTFDRCMEPYLTDPFRGAVARRILGPGETGLTMEVAAARRTLEVAGWTPADLDLVLVSSFLPDQFGPGNAAYLVRALEANCPGINIESACASTLVSINTAVALVQSGQYRNAMVVASCSYSRISPPRDTLSWFVGDGAGALLISPVASGHGWVSSHCVNTAATCGTFRIEMVEDPTEGAVPRLAASKETAKIINESGEPYMREACEKAMRDAGITIDDVACVVANTPTAWYADFVSAVLGIDRSRVVSTYEQFANTGTALLPMNLYAAASAGLLAPGDWVLLYGVGSVSTAVATVMRWSETAVARVELPPPDRSRPPAGHR